jgi:Cytochrome P450
MDWLGFRFLDGEGSFVKSQQVIPFAVGKRVCLGNMFGAHKNNHAVGKRVRLGNMIWTLKK